MGRTSSYSKQIIIYFISFVLIYTPTLTFASAAEDLWKYEPTLKDMKVNVTAHKVDHLGNAVNDNTYKTQIDPKTAANKTAQGRVGMNRLLKVSGWGLVGAAALEALLEAVDWVIDPEAQSIWRNKKGDTSVCTPEFPYCVYKVKINVINSENNPFYSFESANNEVEKITKRKQTEYDYRWKPVYDTSNINLIIGFQLSLYLSKTSNSSLGVFASGQVIESPKPDKEIMTPDVLSDYINHTHPDYADPTLAPKLEPHYKPNEIIPPLWTPQNDYEYENSPTVDIIKKDLDKQNPTSPDKDIEPNPETGGMSLPNFCDWAKVVCDFVKDFNDKPEENKDTELDISDSPLPDINTDINFGGACPVSKVVPVSFAGISTTIEFSFQPLCDIASFIKPVVITISAFSAALIIAGIRENE